MIELIFKDILDTTGLTNIHAIYRPEKSVNPAIIYQVSGFSKEGVLDESIKSHSTKFKLDIYADSYREAKETQQKIVDVFEDLSGTFTEGMKVFTILGDIQDIKDLYELQSNKIVIDIVLNYYIN